MMRLVVFSDSHGDRISLEMAIKNESDDRKDKISVGNVIKNLKDKIEK